MFEAFSGCKSCYRSDFSFLYISSRTDAAFIDLYISYINHSPSFFLPYTFRVGFTLSLISAFYILSSCSGVV